MDCVFREMYTVPTTSKSLHTVSIARLQVHAMSYRVVVIVVVFSQITCQVVRQSSFTSSPSTDQAARARIALYSRSNNGFLGWTIMGGDVTSEAMAVPVFLAGVPRMMHSDTPSMASSLLYKAASNCSGRGKHERMIQDIIVRRHIPDDRSSFRKTPTSM